MQAGTRRKSHPLPHIKLLIAIIICFTISCTITLICCNSTEYYANQLSDEQLLLSREVQEMDEQLEYVRSDAYVERVARDELGLIMPGEYRYVTN